MCLGMEQTSPSPRALSRFAAVSLQGVGAGAGSRFHQPGRPSLPFGLLRPSARACPYHPPPSSVWALRGYPRWQVHLCAGLIVHLPFSSRVPGAGVESNCQDDGKQAGKRNREWVLPLYPVLLCHPHCQLSWSQRALC